MKTKQRENKISFRLCPVRHVLLLMSVLTIAGYFLFRGNSRVMTAVSRFVARPYHRLAGLFSGLFRFSLAELFYVLLVVGLLTYAIVAIVQLVRKPVKGKRLYLLFVTLLTAGGLFYGGFCLLWGVYYDTASFSRENGIEHGEVSVEQLDAVTHYFAGLANTYGAQVDRDENGLFDVPLEEIFDHSASLYAEVTAQYPSLTWPELRAKPFLLSKVLSLINFTGFFFPFTGEANINTDCPVCLIPATIAHELAHQRGVATEDEANFVGILAGMENGDPVYCYSCALLAYIHLGNALYKADSSLWREVYDSLDENVRADLRSNNEYWDRFETRVKEASETVYTGFLQSYGEERGLQSYGDCIDLLIAYYYDEAEVTP